MFAIDFVLIVWTVLCMTAFVGYSIYSAIPDHRDKRDRYDHYVNELDDAFNW